jgi:hypothetical protein
MLQYRIASLTPAELKIATDPKAVRRDNQNGTKVASLNPELQFRRLFAAASTASRTLDSFSRSRLMQKRNPEHGIVGAPHAGLSSRESEQAHLEPVRFRERGVCSAHHTKQEAGLLSITLNGDEDQPELGKWLRVRMSADRQSAEWREADAALAQIQDPIRKRLPKERHQARMHALYVDPKSESEWKRPLVTASPSYAENFLLAAVGDYAGRYYDRYISSPESIPQLQFRDPELCAALQESCVRQVQQIGHG